MQIPLEQLSHFGTQLKDDKKKNNKNWVTNFKALIRELNWDNDSLGRRKFGLEFVTGFASANIRSSASSIDASPIALGFAVSLCLPRNFRYKISGTTA